MSCKHPDGEEQTYDLIRASGIRPPSSILDMGAGDGDTVRLLRSLGFNAVGIDLIPREDVIQGDILNAPFSDSIFDAVISQCVFFAAGDRVRALSESARILRQGGKLLLSDVYFDTEDGLRSLADKNGLDVLYFLDTSKAWQKYYIDCIWNDTAEEFCKCVVPQGKCGYYLMICEKR